MTCSRLFIVGALLTLAPSVTAQPKAPTAPAKASAAKGDAAPKATAQPATAKPAPAAATAAPTAPAAKAAGKTAAPGAKAAPAVKAPAAAALPPPPPAKYPAGLSEPRVRTVRNQVEIAGVDRRAAKKDDLVQPGNKVTTQPQSSAEVTYADGTRVILSENTDLSLYGVAPPPPPPGKKARPAAFKPGTTTLLRGEVLLIIPAPPVVAVQAPPPPPPVAVKGKGGKVKAPKIAKAPKKAPPPKPAITATIATPAGRVIATPGTQLRISVEATGLTRVAVYSGQAQLVGKGKPVVLVAGVGSRIDNAKTPPKPPLPLPTAPLIAGVQQLTFSTGGPVEVRGTYGPAPGTPPATSWHVQVARDAAFDNLISDVRVGGNENRLMPQRIEPGDYYVRVSAIGLDASEGQASAVTRIRVARVTAIPGGEGKRAMVAVEGKDLYCSLDGAPLNPVTDPLALSPARDHLLRCATVPASPRPDETFEQRISAAQSGPLVARLEPGAVSYANQPAPEKGPPPPPIAERQVTLVLSDGAGTPLSGATVRAEGSAGVQISDVKETASPGSYVAKVRQPVGQSGQSLRYAINDVETYEAALPAAAPPAPAEPGKDQPTDSTEPSTAKRFAFELGIFPTAGIDVQRLFFNVGGGLEVGGRIRLPYGALAIAIRPQYEYYPASPAVSHVVAAGLPITYRIRQNIDSDIVPYIGVLPQFIADYSFLARDGVQVQDGQWRTAFGIGGLVGTEFRFKRGAVFVEGGYRHVLLRNDVPDSFASLSGIFANLGLRLTF